MLEHSSVTTNNAFISRLLSFIHDISQQFQNFQISDADANANEQLFRADSSITHTFCTS